MGDGGVVQLTPVKKLDVSDVAEMLKAYIDAKVAYEIRQQAWLKLSFTWEADRDDLTAAEAALREAGLNI